MVAQRIFCTGKGGVGGLNKEFGCLLLAVDGGTRKLRFIMLSRHLQAAIGTPGMLG